MIRVRVISEPLRPPWSARARGLVRDLVRWCDETRFTVMGDGSFEPEWEGVHWRHPYAPGGQDSDLLERRSRAFLDLVVPDLKHQVDHFFVAPDPASVGTMRMLRRLRRKPAVHTLCSIPSTFDGVDRLLFGDVHVALTRWTADRLEEEGVPMVRFIAPGIDPNLVLPDPEAESTEPATHEDPPTVLFPADYEPVAGTRRLLGAWDAVRAAVPDARLVVAVRDAGEDLHLVRDLIQRRSRPGVSIAHPVPSMPALLRRCSVVAFPAERTQTRLDIPRVLLEAMTLSRPVIVADRPPVRETLEYGGGVAVPPDDPEALGHAIVTVLSDESDRARIGQEGRQAVEQHWHIAHAALRYERLYQELTERSP